MTNEELVEAIQNGNESLLPVLWEQVEKFVYQQANRRARQLEGFGGVSVEDLYQSGFLALVEAVQSYAPEKGMSFIGWLTFRLKNAFRAAMGYQADAFHRAKSLDAPLRDEEDESLADIIPDPTDDYEATEERIYREQLRDKLALALSMIPEDHANTIQRRFYQNMTLKQIGEQDGISPGMVRQREALALRKLRHPRITRELEQFIEDRTPYFMRVGVDRFNQTGTSAVEEIVLRREEWRDKARDADRLIADTDRKIEQLPIEQPWLKEKLGQALTWATQTAGIS